MKDYSEDEQFECYNLLSSKKNEFHIYLETSNCLIPFSICL